MGQNVFQFCNRYFEQTNVTAMGNPLSPFLAENFVCRFKTELQKQPNFFKNLG